MWRIRTHNQGFTLLEVMIAVAVIAIALVTLLGSQSQSIRFSAEAELDVRAALLARQRLAEIHQQDFDDLHDDSGDFGEEFASYEWKTTVTLLNPESLGLEQADDMLKAVRITVGRSDDDGRTFSARTIVFRPIKVGESEE